MNGDYTNPNNDNTQQSMSQYSSSSLTAETGDINELHINTSYNPHATGSGFTPYAGGDTRTGNNSQANTPNADNSNGPRPTGFRFSDPGISYSNIAIPATPANGALTSAPMANGGPFAQATFDPNMLQTQAAMNNNANVNVHNNVNLNPLSCTNPFSPPSTANSTIQESTSQSSSSSSDEMDDNGSDFDDRLQAFQNINDFKDIQLPNNDNKPVTFLNNKAKRSPYSDASYAEADYTLRNNDWPQGHAISSYAHQNPNNETSATGNNNVNVNVNVNVNPSSSTNPYSRPSTQSSSTTGANNTTQQSISQSSSSSSLTGSSQANTPNAGSSNCTTPASYPGSPYSNIATLPTQANEVLTSRLMPNGDYTNPTRNVRASSDEKDDNAADLKPHTILSILTGEYYDPCSSDDGEYKINIDYRITSINPRDRCMINESQSSSLFTPYDYGGHIPTENDLRSICADIWDNNGSRSNIHSLSTNALSASYSYLVSPSYNSNAASYQPRSALNTINNAPSYSPTSNTNYAMTPSNTRTASNAMGLTPYGATHGTATLSANDSLNALSNLSNPPSINNIAVAVAAHHQQQQHQHHTLQPSQQEQQMNQQNNSNIFTNNVENTDNNNQMLLHINHDQH